VFTARYGLYLCVLCGSQNKENNFKSFIEASRLVGRESNLCPTEYEDSDVRLLLILIYRAAQQVYKERANYISALIRNTSFFPYKISTRSPKGSMLIMF
jgi:hypothetical protein